jgi:hypothetical protein
MINQYYLSFQNALDREPIEREVGVPEVLFC